MSEDPNGRSRRVLRWAGVDGRLQHAFGLSVRAQREQRGLSQEGFADVLGVHRRYLGGLERGEHNLTLGSVERIADRIGIDAIELLSTHVPPVP